MYSNNHQSEDSHARRVVIWVPIMLTIEPIKVLSTYSPIPFRHVSIIGTNQPHTTQTHVSNQDK